MISTAEEIINDANTVEKACLENKAAEEIMRAHRKLRLSASGIFELRPSYIGVVKLQIYRIVQILRTRMDNPIIAEICSDLEQTRAAADSYLTKARALQTSAAYKLIIQLHPQLFMDLASGRENIEEIHKHDALVRFLAEGLMTYVDGQPQLTADGRRLAREAKIEATWENVQF